jgi:hypothetical protein
LSGGVLTSVRRSLLAVFGALVVAAVWLWIARAPETRPGTLRPAMVASSLPPTALPVASPPPVELVPPPTELASPSNHAPSVRPADDSEHLRELQRLRSADPDLALARALDEDARRPDTGGVAEARRALIVTLLVDEGDLQAARERARDYTKRYPESRYLPLVQGLTGVHPRPSPREMAALSAASR